MLNISGCGFSSEAGIALAEVLSSGCVKLEMLSLDVSNNNFGLTGTYMIIEEFSIKSIFIHVNIILIAKKFARLYEVIEIIRHIREHL